MSQVFLRVSALQDLVLSLKHRQLDVVCLSIVDADPDPECGFPAALDVLAVNSVHPSIPVDMDGPESDDSLSSMFRMDSASGLS